MRIGIVGAGVSGLVAAHALARRHLVEVFEAGPRPGGHARTVDVTLGGRSYAVDTGFIVFNPTHYPLFWDLLGELGVATKPTTMSFGYSDPVADVEYNASRLSSLFAQRRNLARPAFWRMLRDVVRFYREAPALLQRDDEHRPLGAWLDAGGYSAEFRDWHLVPMAAALWSSPRSRIDDFPVRYLVRFMANHHMLRFAGRAPWRVVEGGSRRYVQALVRDIPAPIHLNAPVRSIQRSAGRVQLCVAGEPARQYDHVVLACHADQALRLLAEPTAVEHEVLAAIRYQPNEVVLHSDRRLLPRRRSAWAAWNYLASPGETRGPSVTYHMGLLQGLDAPEPLCVTLNRCREVAPERVHYRTTYHHPIYDAAAFAAQHRRREINGALHTWFCGAYWGYGFHEDGVRSALEVCQAIEGRSAA